MNDPTFLELVANLEPASLEPQGVVDVLFYARHMFKMRSLTIPPVKMEQVQSKCYDYVKEDRYNLRQLIAIHFDISNMMSNPRNELSRALTAKLTDSNETISHIDLRTLIISLGTYKPQVNLVAAAVRRLKEVDLAEFDNSSLINIFERLISLAYRVRGMEVRQQATRFERHMGSNIDSLEEKDISRLLRVYNIYQQAPNVMNLKLQNRTKELLKHGHIEKQLAVELLKTFIVQVDQQYSAMNNSLKEAGMNAAVSILEGDNEYSPDELSTILEFCLRVGAGYLDEEIKALLAQSINKTCYRHEQYTFPLFTKAKLLHLPDIQVEESSQALLDAGAMRKIYVFNMNHKAYIIGSQAEYRSEVTEQLIQELAETSKTELHNIANYVKKDGLRGFTKPEKFKIAEVLIKRASEIMQKSKRYSNYLKVILPFTDYVNQDFLVQHIDESKLDLKAYSDIIKDVEYPLHQLMRLTDINSLLLNPANVINLFFLLNNQTRHEEKLKLAKLLEQVATPEMFNSRVFIENVPEIVPFIEKFQTIMPQTIQALMDYLNGSDNIHNTTAALAGLAGDLDKEDSWYTALYEREMVKHKPNYAALIKIASKLPDMDAQQLKEKIYDKMVPEGYLGINDTWRHFNLFMKHSDLDQSTQEKIIEALRDKTLKGRLNAYDLSVLISYFALPRSIEQRDFLHRGVEVINERVQRMYRWNPNQIDFMLDSINGKSLVCPSLLETLVERVLAKKNLFNNYEFAEIFARFGHAEFIHDTYYEQAAQRISENASQFRWDTVPNLVSQFSLLNYHNRPWAQDAVRALLTNREYEFQNPILRAKCLWAAHTTLGADDEVTQQQADIFTSLKLKKDIQPDGMQMLSQLLHLYPNEQNADAQQSYYDHLSQYNWTGIIDRRRDAISDEMKSFGFETESGIADHKLNVPFYLPKENVAIWPTSINLYLRNGPNIWKGMHEQHRQLIEKAGVKVLTPSLSEMSDLTEEKINDIIRS